MEPWIETYKGPTFTLYTNPDRTRTLKVREGGVDAILEAYYEFTERATSDAPGRPDVGEWSVTNINIGGSGRARYRIEFVIDHGPDPRQCTAQKKEASAA